MSTEIADAPPDSYALAIASVSKSGRIRPLDGEAFFTSAITAGTFAALRLRRRVNSSGFGASHTRDFSSRSGILALRSLDAAVESEGARRKVSTDLVAREIRITLGQLPGGFSDGSGPLKIFGEGETTRQFVTEIAPRVSALGLRIEPMDRPSSVSFDTAPKPEIAASPVLALAAAYVLSGDVGPDFLPPKIAPWRQFVSTKLSTQKLAYAGGAAAVIAVILGGLFGWQQYQLITLRSQWSKIEPRVTELKAEAANIQKFRPWFDQTYGALNILAKLTTAFPGYGTVTVKTLEVQNLSDISVHGTATTMVAFNQVREALGKIAGVEELHADTAGLPPQIQFNLKYQWNPKSVEGADNGK